jgi:glycosyltransferase involved in cell wall biosynthesis
MKSKKRLSLFIRHPAIRDYRAPLFRLLAQQYDVSIFTRPSAESESANCSLDIPTIPMKAGYKRCGLVRDISAIIRGVIKSDVFMSSFLTSNYTALGLLVAWVMRKPTIVWMERSQIRGKRDRWLEKPLSRLVDAFYIMGTPQRRALTELGISDDAMFEANEYPGVNYSNVKSEEIPDLDIRGKRVVLFLGRFVGFKGIPVLLEAYRQIEDVCEDVLLVMAGGGDLQEEMEAKARQLGIKSVVFPGYISSPGQKKHLYEQSQMLVVPSTITQTDGCEGGPLVVLEALSVGLPVLGTDGLISSTQFIKNGVNGFVVPHSNATALFQKMKEMLAWQDRKQVRERVLDLFQDVKGFQNQSEVLDRAIQFAVQRQA